MHKHKILSSRVKGIYNEIAKAIASVASKIWDIWRTSPAEEKARKRPVEVMSCFIDPASDKVTPVLYKESAESFDQNIPKNIREMFPNLAKSSSDLMEATRETESVEGRKPKNIAFVCSGGPASGGNNVVAGIYEMIKAYHPDSKLFAFVGGPGGIVEDRMIEVTKENIAALINTGGFDFAETGRDKIKTQEQFEAVHKVTDKYGIDSTIVIGGDDSATNSAQIGEYLAQKGSKCGFVSVPKTIDGDVQVERKGKYFLPISFGFATATRLYANLVGNLLKDAGSQKKYWFIRKLMGRSASHIALEVALQTRPHWTVIGEEVAQKGWSLGDIVSDLANTIAYRAAHGKNYGVALIPEGVIEFIPEVKALITELSHIMNANAEGLLKQGTIKDLLGEIPEKLFEVVKGDQDKGEEDKLAFKDNAEELIKRSGFNERQQERLIALLHLTEEDVEELGNEEKRKLVTPCLTDESAVLFDTFPDEVAYSLLQERDSHDNLKVSQIPTDRLIFGLAEEMMLKMKGAPVKLSSFARVSGIMKRHRKKVQKQLISCGVIEVIDKKTKRLSREFLNSDKKARLNMLKEVTIGKPDDILVELSKEKYAPDLTLFKGAQLSDEQIDTLRRITLAGDLGSYGYEGRCGLPTEFDANYSTNLGMTAACLALSGQNGVMAAVSLDGKSYAIPLVKMIDQEERAGNTVTVIKKALVDLSSPAFKYFSKMRDEWKIGGHSRNPADQETSLPPITVAMNVLNATFNAINADIQPQVQFGPKRKLSVQR
ncbi:6-phosphofructokinase [Candidatus Margulisiibacteriota bacterium]